MRILGRYGEDLERIWGGRAWEDPGGSGRIWERSGGFEELGRSGEDPGGSGEDLGGWIPGLTS